MARGCAGAGAEISKEDAVEIARGEVSYEPEATQVRLVRRGFQSRPYWAVSLSTLDADGNPDRVTVVLVDARTREVTEVRPRQPVMFKPNTADSGKGGTLLPGTRTGLSVGSARL